MRLAKRVDSLERDTGNLATRPLKLVFQFGGISKAEAYERHEAEHGPIGDADVMVVRGVRPGHVGSDAGPARSLLPAIGAV